MDLIIERYVAEYGGHTIELVRNALVKTMALRIDGKRAAWASCAFPRDIILAGVLKQNGAQHTVTAQSLVHLRSLSREASIAVDGVIMPGTRTP
jgi:hypothetical protein